MEPETHDQTPTATTAATSDNLALRFSYDQLDASHKAMADKVAALIIAYPDITRLGDEQKQRELIADMWNAKDDNQLQAAIKKSGASQEVEAQLRKIPGLGGLFGAAKTTDNVVQNVGSSVSAGARGALAPTLLFTMPSEASQELYNQLKVIANGTTPKQARSLGAAYASVFQAKEQERKGKGFGVAFTSLGNAGAYIMAVFAYAFDAITHGFKPELSFNEHLSRATFKADVKTTREQLVAAKEIDGIATKHWAEALTQGGAVVQNRAGQDTPVAVPTKDNPVPTVPQAPKAQDGTPAVVPTDAGAAIGDAAGKSVGAAGQNLKNAVKGIDTPLEVVAYSAGAVLIGSQAIKHGPGALHAIGQVVGKTATWGAHRAIAGSTGLASGLVQGAADMVDLKHSGKVRKHDDAIKEMEVEKAKLTKSVDARTAKIDSLKAEVEAFSDDKPKFMSKEWREQKATKASLLKEETLLKVENKTLGEADKKIGVREDKLRNAAEKAADVAEHGKPIASRATKASSWLGSKAVAIEAWGNSRMADVTQLASSKLGIEAQELTLRASKIGKVARFGGRAIPFVGAGVGAVMVFGHSTEASAGEFDKISLWERAERDHKRGLLTDVELKQVHALQSGQIGAGFLGIAGAVAVEGGQTGLEKLDPKIMKYVPESMLAAFNVTTREKLGTASEEKALQGLHQATRDASEPAKKLAFARVHNSQNGTEKESLPQKVMADIGKALHLG